MPDKASTTATIAVPGPDQLGEGPVWDDRSGELVWAGISGRQIHRWNPTNASCGRMRAGAIPLATTHPSIVLGARHE